MKVIIHKSLIYYNDYYPTLETKILSGDWWTNYLRLKYRYGRYGIWSIGRKIAVDSVQKIMNSVDKKKLLYIAGSALISSATSPLKKAAEKSLDKVINNPGKFKVTKELIDQLPTKSGGIVYD